MVKILVIGHSHMTALRSAAAGDAMFDFVSCVELKNGKAVEKPVSRFQGIKIADYDSAVFLVQGARHIVLGLTNHPGNPFDFYLPDRPDLPSDKAATLIPIGLIERILKRHLLPEFHYVTALATLFDAADLYLIETPPPLPTKFILDSPSAFADQILQYGVSPLPMRYKLWRVYSGIVREFCRGRNITFLEAPTGTQDRDGSLAALYWRNDPAHANARYGALVLDQIRQRHRLKIDREACHASLS